MNYLICNDDIISEKYHNNGLTKITTFSLGIISNIISSIITFGITNLCDYSCLFEEMMKCNRNKNFIKMSLNFVKYIKIKIKIFHIIEFMFILFMFYYLYIFCEIYHETQMTILINYLSGMSASIIFSLCLSILITITRVVSLKCKNRYVFNFSKYLYEKF